MPNSRNLISLGGPEEQKGTNSTLSSVHRMEDHKANERTKIWQKPTTRNEDSPREGGSTQYKVFIYICI